MLWKKKCVYQFSFCLNDNTDEKCAALTFPHCFSVWYQQVGLLSVPGKLAMFICTLGNFSHDQIRLYWYVLQTEVRDYYHDRLRTQGRKSTELCTQVQPLAKRALCVRGSGTGSIATYSHMLSRHVHMFRAGHVHMWTWEQFIFHNDFLPVFYRKCLKAKAFICPLKQWGALNVKMMQEV